MYWILSAISSVIGATAGATAANLYALKRERKQEAMKLFIAIDETTNGFCNALQKMLADDFQYQCLRHKQGVFDQHNAAMFRTKQEDIDAAEQRSQESAGSYHRIAPVLRGRSVAARLLFGKKSANLVAALNELHGVRDNLGKYDVKDLETSALNPIRQRIEREIETLWKSFDDWDSE